MTDEETYRSPIRPRLAIRVGITGARDLSDVRIRDPAKIRKIETRIGDILAFIRSEVSNLAERTAAKQVYDRAAPSFRMLSPLAEGADRLAAYAALEHRYELMVPMPFPREEYAKDFSEHLGSIEEFGRLLDRADGRWTELDGKRDDPAGFEDREAHAYEAAGRFVARNCDVLIAVWDGKSHKGRGGTFDTLRFATEIGVPVWWIHTEQSIEPAWLRGAAEPRSSVHKSPPTDRVSDYLRTILLPPEPRHTRPSSLRYRTYDASRLKFGRPFSSPHLEFLGEPEPGKDGLWKTYSLFMRAISYRRKIDRPPASSAAVVTLPVGENAARYWDKHYTAPDALSYTFSDRYRSAYVLIFLLTAFSLICAATPLLRIGEIAHECTAGCDGPYWVKSVPDMVAWVAALCEAFALVSIAILVWLTRQRGWQRRWIDYRLLSELFREQRALSPLGWALPGNSIAALSEPREGTEPPSGGGHSEEGAWAIWFYGAVARAAPFPFGVFSEQSLSPIRTAILEELLQDQIDYHQRRKGVHQTGEQRLVRTAVVLFLLVAVLVIGKICALIAAGHPHGLVEFLTIVVPTLVAASFGIRHYAELELFVRQSDHMIGIMQRAQRRLIDVNLSQDLASQDLGAIALDVAIEMLKDIDGSMRLARVKVVEF